MILPFDAERTARGSGVGVKELQPCAARAPGDGVSAFFDARAAEYDRAHDSPGTVGFALRVRMSRVLELVGNGPGELLDVGMGPGRLCSQLSERGWTVSGIDGSANMVDLARSRMPEAASRLAVANVECLPFADGSFDAVTGTGVLEYVDDVSAALSEISRVLRPGGLAILSLPNPRAAYALWIRMVIDPVARYGRRLLSGHHMGRPGSGPVRPRELERRMTAAGLRVERRRHTSFLIVPRPFDQVFPALAVRLAERFEQAGPITARFLATQIVFAVRRVQRDSTQT